MLHLSKKFGYYSILNRQEVLSWFLDKRRKKQNVCGRCQKSDCYTCNRLNYIRTQLEINAYFEAQDWLRQPILWQIFEDFNKEPNRSDKNIYRVRIYIEKTVRTDFFVKNFDLVNNEIIETC